MTPKHAIAIVLLVALLFYLAAPALAAFFTRHPERRLIYRLAPLALLSFLLWLALLAWALTGQRDDALISRYVAKLRGSNRLPMAIALLVFAGLAGSLVPLLH